MIFPNMLCILFFLFIRSSEQLKTKHPIVKTSFGLIQGYTTQSSRHKFAVFLGIPYAKPPVGDLRFEKPQPPNPWKNVKKTIKFGNVCPHQGGDDGKEDCLTLNIFAPVRHKHNGKLFPVYFYIHGGGFVEGSSVKVGKKGILKNVVSEDIVVVTINYRLGPLGFLYTNIPGQIANVGLLDQIEALKWVKRNIVRFGGDPKRVTISGESSGGVSVSWITMSPLSRGLYAQTFSMSGSALNIWGSTPNTVVQGTQSLLNLTGCATSKDVMKCLKDIPLDKFWKINSELTKLMPRSAMTIWHPIFDMSFVGNSKTIAEAIDNAPIVPQLSALTSHEMVNLVITEQGGGWPNFPMTPKEVDQYTHSDLVNTINATFGLPMIFGERSTEAVKSIANFYTSKTKNEKYPAATALVTLLSDILINIGVMREALHRANAGAPVYFFVNECVKKNSPVAGCPHGGMEDLIFHQDTDNRIVKKNILSVVNRFIKTGKPWILGYRVTPDDIPFYHTSLIGPFFGRSLWPKRLEFWNDFYETFGYDWPSGSSDRL